MKPILSIVIANYNYGCFLGRAINSVVSQLCELEPGAVELIVVDGGSTDGSVDVIRQYASHLAWWVSEKDKGQSDAFNKGFQHARGTFLTWLNADDFLLPESLKLILREIQMHPKVDWFTGGTMHFDIYGRLLTMGLEAPDWLLTLARIPSWAKVAAPSTFFRRELLSEAGGFDEQLHYTMDIDLWIKFTQNRHRVFQLKSFLWGFLLHRDSKTTQSVLTGVRQPDFLKERNMIRMRASIALKTDRQITFRKRICWIVWGSYLRRWFVKQVFGLTQRGKWVRQFLTNSENI